LKGTIKRIETQKGSGAATIHFEDGESIIIDTCGIRMMHEVFEDHGKLDPVGVEIDYEENCGLMVAFSFPE